MKIIRNTASRTLWVFAILMFVGLLPIQDVSAQGWYDTSWEYRVPVTVSNGGSALTDFQVKITL
ncbi:MAG: hypothetical protein IH593_10265, partial [Bacteroidales bacterium]|nr:hypothetical protein [Bacteroidales bacterium]